MRRGMTRCCLKRLASGTRTSSKIVPRLGKFHPCRQPSELEATAIETNNTGEITFGALQAELGLQ